MNVKLAISVGVKLLKGTLESDDSHTSALSADLVFKLVVELLNSDLGVDAKVCHFLTGKL